MQGVLREDLGRPATRIVMATPVGGSRVSWGSVLAGTVALFAVSLILSGLALAIVSVLTHPTLPSLKMGAIVLWACAIVATLVGAVVGGWLAGYLPGRMRTGGGAMHGFLAWSLALVLGVSFQVFAFRGMLGAAVNTAVESAAVAFEVNRTATESAGPPQFADRSDAPSRGEAAAAGRTALGYVAGFGWSWFGTWFLAGIAAMASAAAGARRSQRSESLEEEPRERDVDRPMGPLTPAPTA